MAANSRQIHGYRDEYRKNDLVADTSDVPSIIADLGTLGIALEAAPEESPRLGLTLLALPDLGGAMPALRADTALLERVMAVRGRTLPAGIAQLPPDDLDLLLSKLRSMRTEHRVVGKNRFVDDLETLGEINGGGSHKPVMIELETLASSRGAKTTRPAGYGIKIGIIDTAVYDHHDFDGRQLVPPPAKWVPPADPDDEHRAAHATMGVGIILQHAPGAELIVKSALDEAGEATAWAVASAMAEFLDNPVDILHMPCGGVTQDGEPPLVLQRAVELVVQEHGTVIVAAAGNLGLSENPLAGPLSSVWPAALDVVTAVAAVDADGDRPPFSADPEKLDWVDISAQGAAVPTTYPEDRFACALGTSFAAANVTGVLAVEASRLGGDVRAALENVRAMPPRSIGTGVPCGGAAS